MGHFDISIWRFPKSCGYTPKWSKWFHVHRIFRYKASLFGDPPMTMDTPVSFNNRWDEDTTKLKLSSEWIPVWPHWPFHEKLVVEWEWLQESPLTLLFGKFGPTCCRNSHCQIEHPRCTPSASCLTCHKIIQVTIFFSFSLNLIWMKSHVKTDLNYPQFLIVSRSATMYKRRARYDQMLVLIGKHRQRRLLIVVRLNTSGWLLPGRAR